MAEFRTRILLLAFTFTLSSCVAAPGYRGPESEHFNGSVFVNREPMLKGPGDMVRLGWGSLTQAEEWPEWIEVQTRPIAQERIHEGIVVTYINHATFLVQVDGVNILTDPIWAQRASPVQWAGPERVHQPGVRFEDLPPIDIILISHNHYDHLDEHTLRRFAAMEEQPVLVAGLGNRTLFEKWGLIDARDLDWDQVTEVGGVGFRFTECRHRSGRGLGDQMKTLWGSFIIHSSEGNLYFAGDSGYGPHFAEAGSDHGPFRLALLPVGAYEPRWFMKDVHVNPAEAVTAHLDLRSEFSIGMHFGTFQLTYEAIDQPVIDLAAALQEQGVVAQTFVTMEPGEHRVMETRTETDAGGVALAR